MSQTSFFLPVPFARFQDPSTRSDAPSGGAGAATPAGGGSDGTTQSATPGAPGAPQGPCAGDGMLWMMPMFLVLMYFFMIRPEQKRKKEQQNLLASIKQGDRVVTISGMHGEVSSLTDATVTLRVDTVHMTFDRSSVARIVREDAGEGDAAAS